MSRLENFNPYEIHTPEEMDRAVEEWKLHRALKNRRKHVPSPDDPSPYQIRSYEEMDKLIEEYKKKILAEAEHESRPQS